MKKYIVLLISIVGVLFMSNVKAEKIELPEKTDHEIVKVYLFRGAGCSHCYDFLTYFHLMKPLSYLSKIFLRCMCT